MNQIYHFLGRLHLPRKMKMESFTTARTQHVGRSYLTALGLVLMFSLMGSVNAYSQTTYYSKSTAVDFNNVASWGTATDGTGAAPSAISNADNFVVANNAALALTGNAAVRQLTINSGSLTVTANSLSISKAAGFDTTFSVASGASLNISGGTVSLNGSFTLNNGANFSQSGGNFVVDGNDGGAAATSVASGTPIFRIGTSSTTYSTGTLNLTGGTITIVDPHVATTNTSAYALYVNFPSGFNVESGTGHTWAFGNGVSTDAGGNTSGFYADSYVGSGRLNYGNLVINNPTGTNRSVTTPFAAGVHGNVTVMAGELKFAGGGLILKGNLMVTGGAYTASVATTFATPSGTGSVVNTTPQSVTVTAPGVIRNATTGETANFTTVVVNNSSVGGVTFNGASNIATQPANSVSTNTVTFTAGKIATTGNAIFVLGNSTPSAGTLNYTSGGFASGTTFGRWFTDAGTGSSFTAGTDVSSTTSRYPFVNGLNQDRSAWIERVTPTTAAGILGITYTNNPGTTAVSLMDGTTAVDTKANDTWAVSVIQGNPTSAGSFKLQIQAPGIFGAPLSTATARIVQGSTFVGAHQAGTITPGAQRVTITPAELVAGPFTIATSAADIAFASIASGDWNNAAIWNKGTVPACTDAVYIAGGTTVTANSAGAVAKNLTISTGGTLMVSSGDLTVGCTLKNNIFTNNGTLTVTGGTFTVNGSMLHAAGSTFNQSGGDINVDGNDAGNAANSVASGTSIVQINTQNITWTGGMFTVVDPHANSTATNTFTFTNSTANVNVLSGHTLRFGDGVSTDAGGSATNGFRVAIFAGSNRISFNDFVVNGGSGTNRFVSATSSFGINGNLTITANSEYRDNGVTTHVTGNVVNNGMFVSTGTLAFQSFLNGTAAAVTTAQTVSGSGMFVNLTAAPTANFTSVTINNTSAAGVTMPGWSNIASQPANSASASGTLTFTAGRLTTSGGASFALGTAAPAAGTLSWTSGGFTSGITFGRWYSPTGTGSSFTAGADTTTATSRYPFVNASGQDRSAWIERVAPVAAGGLLGVTYNNTAGTSAVSATDGTFAVDTKANDTWSVSAMSGTPLAAGSFKFQIQAPGIFGVALASPNTRIIQGSTFVGTHQGGTVTPGGQRILLTGAELTAAPFTLAVAASDIPFYAVVSGDWNNAATWNKNSVPTCNDMVVIPAAMNVTVNSAANVSKNVTIAALGTLTIASGDLTIGCTNNNATLLNNGTLMVTGGALAVNGNINNALAASVFSQSGGMIKIDGNAAGVTANSVASGTPLFNSVSTNISLTGGTLMFVDPHTATTNTNAYTIYLNNGTATTATLISSPSHTTVFGDGTSTDAGGNTNGFYINNWAGTAYLSLGSVVVNGAAGTNRNVTSVYAFTANGNVDVNAGSTLTLASLIVGGNLTVNTGGTFVNTTDVTAAVIASNTSSALTYGPAVNAQTFTNNGTVANLAASPTANFTALRVGNTSASGLTLASPFSISGSLILNTGKVNTTSANLLTLGTATAAGTLTGGSDASYINGPFARTIASGNANTNYILFPVGKTTYAPISLAPATTTVAVMKAEAFESNTGTMDASIINLTNGRRWEAPLVSGTVTSVNVRLGDPALTAVNIPVMAPAANGIYTGAFGSTATFATATPNTITSTIAAPGASYTGFISYAESNLCSGTPAPGNTISSANNLCAGNAITLSVQNITAGSGVTYQWQSSIDGVNYTDINGATAVTYTTTPTAALYYRLNVTCSNGAVTGTSAPVQIMFNNAVTATTPATRCGAGEVTLGATGNGGSIVKWYADATGGTPIATGTTYSPNVTATTTYYAAATTTGGVNMGGKLAPESDWTGTSLNDWGIVFTALQSTTLQSVDVYSTSAGTLNVKVTNATGTELYATGNINVAAGGTTTPTTIPLNFALTAGSTYKVLVKSSSGVSLLRGSSNLNFPYTNSDISVTASEWGGTTTGTYYFFYNFKTEAACASPRVPVVATVTTPPTLTLSSETAIICNGQSATITATAGAADYDTYVWTPSTGVSGNATSGWVFNPTATTTYTLSASQSAGSMCTNSKTVVVTVNPVPVIATSLGEDLDLCLNSVHQLTFGANVTATATSGTGASNSTAQSTGAALGPNPLQNYYGGAKQQWLYTAAELTAMGFSANTRINAIALNLAAFNASPVLNGLVIKMKNTTTASFASVSSWVTNLTTVKPASNYTPVAGLNNFALTTPFVWDGTSNLVIEMSYSNANSPSTGTNSAKFSPTAFASTIYYRADNTSATDMSAYTGDASFTYSSRNDVTFSIANPAAVTWTPAANLYTDAAATVAYNTGSPAASVYVKSATAGDTTYTATATTGAGCTITETIDVSVYDCSFGWVNLQWPASGAINNCGSHDVYAQVYKAGVTEAAGQGANITAWIGVSSANTDPSTWSENDWHLATFNVQVGNNDEYMYTISGLPAGTYYYASRFRFLDGAYAYGGFSGGPWDGTTNVSGVLTVTAVAAPTADASQTFCNSGTVANLVAAGATGATFKWYSAATGGTALAATTALTNGGVFYASQTVDGCESPMRTMVTVTLNTPGAPVAAASQTVCNSGTLADLNAVGGAGATISWFADATGGTALPMTTALTNGGVYYAAATISGCESATRTMVTVTLNTPGAPVADAAQTVCGSGTLADLDAVGGAGASISWYADATGGTALPMTTALTNGGVYYAAATITGCESATRTMVTVTLSSVTVPTISTVQPTCASATGSVTVNSPVGAGYTYSINGTTFQASNEFTSVASGDYTITVQNTAGCTATTTVTINAAPAAPATPMASVTQPTCSVATGSITVTSPVGAGMTYSIDGTNFQAGATFGSLVPGTYTVTVQNAAGCTATSVVLTVNPAPAAPNAPEATALSFCNVAATVADLTATGDNLQWYADETGGTALAVTTAVSTGTYYVSQTVTGCESDRTAVSVTVNMAATPGGEATQQITVSDAADATIEDIVTDATGTMIWYPTQEDAENGTNAIPAGTQLVSGNTYYGTQTVGTCESAFFAVTVDVVLGKDEFTKDAFSFYPNPVKDVLEVSYTSEISSIEVFDLLGQRVLVKQPNAIEATIDMAGLADATYIVNVTAGSTVKTIKIVKKQ